MKRAKEASEKRERERKEKMAHKKALVNMNAGMVMTLVDLGMIIKYFG
jgi:hypothetical protein